VKKLIEGLSFYRDKLHEEGVYARFQEILVKVRTPCDRWSHPAFLPSYACRHLPLPLPCLFSLFFSFLFCSPAYLRRN